MRSVIVTVEHPFGEADLELPIDVPISGLLPALIDACSAPQAGAFGLGIGQLALGLSESGAFPPGSSLGDYGVRDGMRLVLQDPYAWQSVVSRVEASPLPADIVSSTQTGGIGIRWRRDI